MRNFYVYVEFCRKQYWWVISDIIRHKADDAISEALLVCLTIIEIMDAFVDFALFNTYCLNDGFKHL